MYVGFAAPINVRATVLTSESIEVTWDKSSGVTGYLISYTSASHAGNGNVIVTGGDTTRYILYGLKENCLYNITVQGNTADGRKSENSTTISITTQKASK